MEISIKWNLCRVCLKSEKSELVSLFNDAKLVETIKECTGKTVGETDGLPDQICFGCISDLNETHKFLTKFKKSDAHLTSIVLRTMSTRSLIRNDIEDKNVSKVAPDESSNSSVLNSKVKNKKKLAKDSTTTPYKILFSPEEDMREQQKKKSHDTKNNTKSKTDEDSDSDNDNKNENRQTINEDMYIDEFFDVNKNDCSDDGEGDACEGDEDVTGGKNNDYIIVLNDNKTKIKLSHLSNDDDETHTLEENEEDENLFQIKDEEFDNASNQGEVYVLSDINSIEQMIEEDDGNDNDNESTTGDLQSTEIIEAKTEDQGITITSVESGPKKSTVKSHMCLICSNTFTRVSSLKTHMSRHKNLRKYKCELCSKSFGTSNNLANHMRIHTGEKPFECEYCQRRFADRSTHLKHTRIHTNERPFTCDQCGKSFTLSTTLKAHEIIHTGIKQHECFKCNKAFKLPHQLKAHLNTFSHKMIDGAMDLDS